MGTSASENIAIAVTTTADVTALVETRKQTTALGAETKRVSQEITQATKSAAAGENSLAAASTKATTASTALVQTTAKAASAQSTVLSGIPGQARTAANALGILSQAALSGQGSLAGMAAAAGNLASGLSTVAKSAKVAAAATGIGALVTVLGIGYGIVSGFKEEAKKLANQLEDLKSAGRGLDAALAGDDLAGKLEQINRAADKEIQQAKELSFLQKKINADELQAVVNAIETNRAKSKGLATQESARSAAKEQAGLELMAARTAEQRFAAQARLIELERKDRERRGVTGANVAAAGALDDLAKPGKESLENARTQVGVLIGQLQGAREARRRSIEAEYQSEQRGLDSLTLADGVRNELLAAYTNKRKYALDLLTEEMRLLNQSATIERKTGSDDATERFQGRLMQIDAEREAAIRAGVDIAEADAIANQKRRQVNAETSALVSRSFRSMGVEMQNSMRTAIQANASLAKVLTTMLLSPIVKELDALSASEAVKAVAHFATGDIFGGAAHTATSALAAAAAAKIASQGGLGSSGGGGGGGGAGAGPGPTFTPRDTGSGGGDVTVILQTVDPRNGDLIAEVGWLLQRNGTLKKPLYAPSVQGGTYSPSLRSVNFT